MFPLISNYLYNPRSPAVISLIDARDDLRYMRENSLTLVGTLVMIPSEVDFWRRKVNSFG